MILPQNIYIRMLYRSNTQPNVLLLVNIIQFIICRYADIIPTIYFTYTPQLYQFAGKCIPIIQSFLWLPLQNPNQLFNDHTWQGHVDMCLCLSIKSNQVMSLKKKHLTRSSTKRASKWSFEQGFKRYTYKQPLTSRYSIDRHCRHARYLVPFAWCQECPRRSF